MLFLINHNMTAYLMEMAQVESEMEPKIEKEDLLMNKITEQCPEDWATLVTSFEESEKLIGIEWGNMILN